jgi:hypothetical protein
MYSSSNLDLPACIMVIVYPETMEKKKRGYQGKEFSEKKERSLEVNGKLVGDVLLYGSICIL